MFEALRLKRNDRQLQRANALDGRRGRAGFPDQHRVGTQRQQPFQVDAECIADAGNAARGIRMIAVLDGRDDAIARAGIEREFGEVRSETDDALRWRGGVSGSGGEKQEKSQAEA